MSQTSIRNVRVDAMRGLLLIVMTIDHFPSVFQGYTYESLGYVTAAEGFVFLSGWAAGLVYGRYGLKEGAASLWRRARARAWRIYLYHIFTFLVFLVLAVAGLKTFGLETWAPKFYDHPVLSLSTGLVLIYKPHFLDVLPLYCLLILIVPLIVGTSRLKYHAGILVVSAALWAAAQFGLEEAFENVLSNHLHISAASGFSILAWQFIFVLGVLAGNPNRVRIPWTRGSRIAVFGMSLAVAVVLLLVRHGWMRGPFVFKIEDLSAVPNLGPVRLLDFLSVAFVIASIPWPEDGFYLKTCAYLGRHSLQVFTFHLFLIFLLFGLSYGSPFQELWVGLFVASLFLPAWYCERRKPPRPVPSPAPVVKEAGEGNPAQ